MNIVDSLIVTLGLDASEFASGTKKVEDGLEKTKNKAKETAEETADVINKGLEKTKAKTAEAAKTAEKSLDKTTRAAKETGKAVKSHGEEIVTFLGGITGAPIQTAQTRLHDLATGAIRAGSSVESGALAGRAGLVALGSAALVAFAAIKAVGAAVGMTLGNAPATAMLGRVAADAGVPTSALSSWGIAAKTAVGADPKAIESGILSLSQNVRNAALGFGTAHSLEMMSMRLGVPFINNSGGGRPTPDILLSLADKLSKMSKPDALAEGTQAGLSPDMIHFLEQGRAKVSQELAAAKPLAETGKQAAAAQGLVTAMNKLSASEDALGRAISQDMTPALTTWDNRLAAVMTVLTDMLTGHWKAAFDYVNKHSGAKPLSEYPALPGGASPPPGAPLPSSAEQKTRESAMMQQFMAAGYPRAAAAAMTAQAMAESSMNPRASNAGHVGLFQWSAARRKEIMAGTGIDVAHASQAGQVKAALWELSHGYKSVGDRLRTEGAGAGAVDASDNYEKPGARGSWTAFSAASNRSQLAKRLFAMPPGHSLTSVMASLRAKQGAIHHHGPVHVGVTVHAKSADAHGIGRETAAQVRQAMLVIQANTGLA